MQNPAVCGNCGGPGVETGYAAPLCRRCRDMLACRPVPRWINVVFVAVLLVMAFAFTRFPASLQAGVAFERGKRAVEKGNYAGAAVEYRKVLRKFPDSTEAMARLAIAEYHAGQVPQALGLLDRLSGRKAPSEELASEINRIIEEVNSRSASPQSNGAP